MKKALVAIALLLLAGAAALILSLWQDYQGFQAEVFVDIPRGTGTRGMGAMLEQAGVVRSRWQFLLVRAFRPRSRLQAGEYRFDSPASAWAVFDRITRGDVYYHELAVPEGYNMFDIAVAVEQLRVMPAVRFLEAARNPGPIRDLAAEAPTLEGYLFPDTYRLTRYTTAEELCLRMTQRFRQAWRELGSPGNVHAAVTLASLLEKETGVPAERPIVASVFLNRVRVGMPLQCDPTAIYAALLENRYRGAILRSDLESKNRYNTYQSLGLPPGPISNPGLVSLRAATQPAQTDYLYFVARPDGSGAHEFSRELTAHQRAVQRYRRGNHQNNQARPAERVPGAKPAPADR